ncbi:MAG: hypothetical protein V2A73_10045 [Pseudomonadota bacterium]
MARPHRHSLARLATPLGLLEFLALLPPVVLGSCVGDMTVASVDHNRAPGAASELDILVVVDNSSPAGTPQHLLASELAAFVAALDCASGGVPSIHLGVVSTDLGDGEQGNPGCFDDGDGGRLQDTPRLPGCSTLDEPYLIDRDDGNGGRDRNFEGRLEDALACIATLGSGGCAVAQPLEAMARALRIESSQDAGFLRDEAYLAVIFVTGRDDCSAADTQAFAPRGRTGSGVVDFHCAEAGLVCGENEIPSQAGTYHDCRPRDGCFLHHPEGYVNLLLGLKPDLSMLVVGLITGPPAPLTIELDSANEPVALPACTGSASRAFASPRLDYFGRKFPNSFVASICAGNAGASLAEMAATFCDGIAQNLPSHPVGGRGCRAVPAAAVPQVGQQHSAALLVVLVVAVRFFLFERRCRDGKGFVPPIRE